MRRRYRDSTIPPSLVLFLFYSLNFSYLAIVFMTRLLNPAGVNAIPSANTNVNMLKHFTKIFFIFSPPSSTVSGRILSFL